MENSQIDQLKTPVLKRLSCENSGVGEISPLCGADVLIRRGVTRRMGTSAPHKERTQIDSKNISLITPHISLITPSLPMKIAIASSGLGHVARGIETWACDTAVVLSEVRSQKSEVRSEYPDNSLNVTLFCAAPIPPPSPHSSPLTHHSSPITLHPSPLTIRVIPCWKRGDKLVKFLTRISPGFTWRWGWKSAYDLEQKSFWRHLWPILRDEEFDILHVQDPLLADLCRRYREKGKLRTKEILAHGTEESVEFLAKFDYVQHLAPWHLSEARQALRSVQ